MSDPSLLPTVAKKVLSLDTPIAKRIFEIALMLALIAAAGYIGDHYNDKEGLVGIACSVIEIFGTIVLMLLVGVLVATIVHDAKSTMKK